MHLLVAALLAWNSWNASAIVSDRGYPVFTVDGKPFFVYGAAFFYERIPRDRWRDSLLAYKRLGINTIDLYVIWNWHEPTEGAPDFTGATDPRRDLRGLLDLTHELAFKIVLRPGPVIRNEWRNGGYPDWLLERPEYDMPSHDVLEGRYPATATLQNAHADAAAVEWLGNATHLRYAARWLHDALTAVAPHANDVIAIALDDDQGAYLDNDTWPAPHWHSYIDWLRGTVQSTVGRRVPLFLNTFEMKVPAAAPAWSWGNWYQSDTYSVGAHDLAELDFATGLLQTQPHVPVMQAEFQAGWLQGADEGEPRPADPTNTTLALNELLRDGVHGIVNFPVQDTVYPDGWEAPWTNWSYAWDAALTTQLDPSLRYAPTAAFGEDVAVYGSFLARTHPAVDAAIIWPPSLFAPGTLTNATFAALKDATVAMQQECKNRRLTCEIVDPAHVNDATSRRIPLVLPASRPSSISARLGRPVSSLSAIRPSSRLSGASDATLLLADDASYAFVDVINPSDTPRSIGPIHVTLSHAKITLPAFRLAARSAALMPVGLSSESSHFYKLAGAMPPPFADSTALVLQDTGLRAAFAPGAGARIAELSAPGQTNVASSVGLLRDAVDPEPSPSARDYIAAYTHPLPSGTFNRTYTCIAPEGDASPRTACSYDAPDLPAGGAYFGRTLALDGDDLIVNERFTPKDATSTARLESISGFAFAIGDTVVSESNGVGILHGNRLAAFRWRSGDVARVTLRATRGAEIVTLVFSSRDVRLRLGVLPAADEAEARRLLQANPRDSSP